MTTAAKIESPREARRVPLADKKSLVHKRMERWIRLQQFVYGLPDDYSYAICLKETSSGSVASRSLVKVGWMSWFGSATGADRQHSLAISLLNTSEALSANPTAVFLHKLNRLLSAGMNCFFKSNAQSRKSGESKLTEAERELLAG